LSPGIDTLERTRESHIPVMLAEVLAALEPRDGALYVDGTFGAGGYSSAILGAADCRVLGLDRDPSAVRAAAPLVEHYGGRLSVMEARFSTMAEAVRLSGLGMPAGIVLDIGVSSMQLDEAGRGFSFMTEGPLDMRMGSAGGAMSEGAGASAAEVVNTAPAELIADILYQLGEERRSRAIAAAIVRRRAERPITTTLELAEIVTKVLGRPRPGEKHPATRTFQALRIWVNNELGELARALMAAEALLPEGGRLVVVTFHSLEDRIVKQFMANRSGRAPGASRHLPVADAGPAPGFRIVNSKQLSPSNEEVAANPRARSARLRAAERTAAAAWKPDLAALGLPEVILGR
jgi:16S rRNA (cytosine1402-N4)-methyltransferase